MDSLNFQPIVSPLILAGVIGLLLAMLLVSPSFANLTWGRRLSLMGLRLVTILLVLLTLVRPGCLSTVEKKQSAVLLFLVDQSRSMSLPHRDERKKRWEALIETVSQNTSKLEELRELQVDVRFIGFDNQSKPIEYHEGIIQFPIGPDGAETDIGKALAQATTGLRDQRVIGVFLLSDGVQTALDSDVELVDAANDLANQGVPLYALPFGVGTEVGQLADIAITNLPDHDSVFVKNRKTVRASLVTRGFANQNVTVQLVISGKDYPEKIVDQKTYTPRQSYEEQAVELSFVPEKPGSYRMTVRAVKMPNESAALNNELTSFLTVYEGGLRVLLLCDVDWWEQNRLRRTLPASGSAGDRQDSQGIEIVYLGINQASRANWPLGGEITAALRDPSIDAIIIADVDSRALFQPQVNEENLRAIEEAVARGKGLMMAGGLHSFGPGYYWRTPLADVLPIQMTSDERQEFDRDPRKDLHITGELRPKPVAPDDPLVQLSDSGDVFGDWKKLPPLPGANRFAGIKDTAQVLLAGQNDEPILVKGYYGAGRVLAFAADSSYLWYNHRHRDEYKRFWQQIILWLAFPDGTAKDSVRIHLGQRRFSPQAPVTFTTEARTITGQPIDEATFEAKVISPTRRETPIVITQSKDLPRGIVPPESISIPGIYAIRVSAKKGSESIGETEVEFSVYDQDKEKSNPAADPKLLARLADQTKDYGGKLIPPEELGAQLDAIAANPSDLKIKIPQRWQLGQSAADGGAFLILFVLALSVEWFFRKKWGMV